jgi:hypothetical protein
VNPRLAAALCLALLIATCSSASDTLCDRTADPSEQLTLPVAILDPVGDLTDALLEEG